MRSVLYGGHISSSTGGCPNCGCRGDCPICRSKGYKKNKVSLPIQRVTRSRRIGSSDSTTRSKPSTGTFVSKCQQIKDPAICNRSQILNANNLPTTGQVTLQTCGYYEPNKKCYPVEMPINKTKIINVDPNIPGILSTLTSLN